MRATGTLTQYRSDCSGTNCQSIPTILPYETIVNPMFVSESPGGGGNTLAFTLQDRSRSVTSVFLRFSGTDGRGALLESFLSGSESIRTACSLSGACPDDLALFTASQFTVTLTDTSTGATRVLTPVPEPGTWALMLLGFGAVGASMRRQRRVAAQLARSL